MKSGELNHSIITKTEETITQEAIENSSAKIVPSGTLLMALYGSTVGKLAFLGIDAATNQAVAALKTTEFRRNTVTKQQLANDYGVSARTTTKWMKIVNINFSGILYPAQLRGFYDKIVSPMVEGREVA